VKACGCGALDHLADVDVRRSLVHHHHGHMWRVVDVGAPAGHVAAVAAAGVVWRVVRADPASTPAAQR
jgi:hypothetical protein